MSALPTLWLPIVASTVVVFVLSWIIHAVLPWHKGDLKKIPNQDQVQDALRPFNIAPGDYMLPGCDNLAEMNTAAFKDKMIRGPVLIATVKPNGTYNMGKSLLGWFIYCLVVTGIAAVVGAQSLIAVGGVEMHHGAARRIIGIVAFVGYSAALWQNVIWYSRSAAATLRSTIDAIIYGVATAFIFGWLS
ncbi:MAG TPA: hypothetical protein VGL42_05065 [Opitutaceae bacterium]|jgi:hypothetical protein